MSYTTRPKKAEEKEVTNYYFVSESEFQEKVLNDEFLEYTCINGNMYGTTKKELERIQS